MLMKSASTSCGWSALRSVCLPLLSLALRRRREKLLEFRRYAIQHLAVESFLDYYLHFHPEEYVCSEKENERICQMQEQLRRHSAYLIERIHQRSLQIPLTEEKDRRLMHLVFGVDAV